MVISVTQKGRKLLLFYNKSVDFKRNNYHINMENNPLHNQMDSFNLNAPVNVTVYIEDSDKENSEKEEMLDDKKKNSKYVSLNTQIQTTKNCDVEITQNICNNKLQINNKVKINNDIHPYSNLVIEEKKKKNHKSPQLPTIEPCEIISENEINIRIENTHQSDENPVILNEPTTQVNITDNAINNDHTITNLLNNVSEHLLIILKVYHHINNKQDLKGDTCLLDKDEYIMRIKKTCFNLSYSTVSTIFLPQNENVNFMKKFIENTFQMAKMKNIQCSYSLIQNVYIEMIFWTKQIKEKVVKILPELDMINNQEKSKNKRGYPILHEQLNKIPRLLCPYTTSFPKRSNKCRSNVEPNKTCIYSCGPKGREISINIDPTLLTYQNKCNENCASLRTVTTEQIMSRYSQNNTTRPPEISTTNTDTYSHHTTSSISSQSQHYLHQNILISDLQNKNQTAIQTLNRLPQMSNVCQNLSTPIQIENHTNDFQLPQRQNEMHNQINTSQLSLTLNNNFTNQNYYNVDYNQRTNTHFEQAGPSTTRATSFNPKVSFITEGKCCVCGKVTRQVCVGCYKIYYCSSICQNSNWNYHMSFCNVIENRP